jgi:chemotaxis protein methyltransferase CheR
MMERYNELDERTILKFIDFIRERCGIELTLKKAYLIESRLSGILYASGMNNFEELFNLLMRENQMVRINHISGKNVRLTDQIIDAITTNETLWFRDKHPWIYIKDVLLPKWIAEIRSGKRKKVRIWSAASSTGQEAYSTAIAINEYLENNFTGAVGLEHFEIVGTDISGAVIEIANNAKYDQITISRGLEPSLRDKYFTKSDDGWRLHDNIHNAVRFERFNLQDTYTRYYGFDLVFLRYVLIYFSTELKMKIIEKMSESLNDDGIMFLGANEYFEKIKSVFTLNYYDEKVPYFTRKATNEARGRIY